jgi:hypothetical protein
VITVEPTGARGAAGTSATVAVGTTTTGAAGSSAIVTNSGTTSAAVFNFTIPRGDTGAAGASGGSSTAWRYKAKTNATSGYPTNGHLLWNNATQNAATEILVSHLDDEGTDVEFFLSFFAQGQKIFIQNRDDSSQNQVWEISGTPTVTNPNTSTSYYTFPVTLISSTGGEFNNNHSILFGSIAAAVNAVTSATTSDGTANLSIADLEVVGGEIYTDGDYSQIYTQGTDAHIFTLGSGAEIFTVGEVATIATQGANATISTAGAGATIGTQGANATIYTQGANATISTAGSAAHIQTSHASAAVKSTNFAAVESGGASLVDGSMQPCLTWSAGGRNLTIPSGTATTFNTTSYTYGTGAAAAHRTALGLTTLATTTPAANVATFLETPSSANLAAAVTGETGTGALVFGTSPTIDAPTISGSAAFTSTTRPTSAGTGAPSATSLMTNADVTLAELHYRHAAKNRFISTLLPTAIAGSVGNAANNNGVQLSITLPNTFSAVSFGSTQLHNSFSGAQMSFARPFMASLVFYLRGITDLNAVIRFFVASPNSYLQGVDALSQTGICVEIARSGTNVQARLVYFSGTFKTTSWVNIGVTSDFFARTNTLVIRNNGTGTFDVFILSTPENVLPGSITKPISNLFGTPTITVSDGPTTAPSANVALISSFGATVADTPTANNFLIVQNFTLEFTS